MKKIIIIFIGILIVSFMFYKSETVVEDPRKVIGVLMTGENRLLKLEGLRDGLNKFGYTENQLQFLIKQAEDDARQLDVLAYELLEEEVDMIASFGGIETQVLNEILIEKEKEVPVVFVGMAAPLEVGIIDDFRQPKGNFTGVNNYHMSMSSKRLELFHELLPDLERVVVLYSEGIDISRRSLQVTKEAAEKIDMPILPTNIEEIEDLQKLKEILTSNDGILTMPSFQIEGLTDQIVAVSMEYQIPAMGVYKDDVHAGYLVSYGTSFYGQGYQAARHISLILQGNQPQDIPVELPDQLEFYLNEGMLQELNITINKDLMNFVEIVGEER
ncbi:ABC transporter substrate-binding protein [Bacillus shivajii]|uniref:ABC transporter substrate-binding protein n=1 Tax=Bacillus shivajii TaxID=1983719 RepID=UPI001CFB746F|nr:ABC transporter substrate-binding protein [Bacillus shivajii]UCZ52465.1 ABC transporter substrate-binding protein [Bacillus shivajii]